MDMKEYKPLCLVFYVDGEGNRSALPLDETKINDFKQAVENSKMIELEGVIINTFDIKEIRPSTHTSEIEKYFYSRTIEERSKIKNRAIKRTGDRKQNVIEVLSQIPDAISRMEKMIEYEKQCEFEKTLPISEKREFIGDLYDTDKLTEEQKEIIKNKFQNLKRQLSKPI